MPELEFKERCDCRHGPRIPMIEKLMKKMRQTVIVIVRRTFLAGRSLYLYRKCFLLADTSVSNSSFRGCV
jgi:hypothetical protein